LVLENGNEVYVEARPGVQGVRAKLRKSTEVFIGAGGRRDSLHGRLRGGETPPYPLRQLEALLCRGGVALRAWKRHRRRRDELREGVAADML